MTPDGLRCESLRPGGPRPWRYSLAALIVVAAVLDVIWWVPAQRAARDRSADAAALTAQTPQCRRRQLEREIATREAELRALRADLDALDE
jgi:hypothetical protein